MRVRSLFFMFVIIPPGLDSDCRAAGLVKNFFSDGAISLGLPRQWRFFNLSVVLTIPSKAKKKPAGSRGLTRERQPVLQVPLGNEAGAIFSKSLLEAYLVSASRHVAS